MTHDPQNPPPPPEGGGTPASPYGAPQQPPPAQSPYGQPGYGAAPPYGESAYGQPQPGQPQPGQPQPYGQPGAYAPPAGPFYVSQMGQEQGPLQFGDLAQWAQAGHIRGDTLVRGESGQWYPAKQVPGLFSDKEFQTAWLLALFLGSFGVDRFYLGYTGLGIAKIAVSVVTLCLGGWIWQLIDLILILTRKMPDAQGRPLS